MNLLSLEAILLFAFSIPVVMGYRILPVAGSPYWLFGILFLLLTTNILISTYAPRSWKTEKTLQVKEFLLWVILVIVVGGTAITAIVDRSRTAPVYGVHDIILQQEAAMRYLLQGKNPYKETYFGTLLEEFNYDEPDNTQAVNPALYHFVMPPWYLIFPFTIYFVTVPLLGFFDGRFALVICLFGLLIILRTWFRHRPLALLAITITAVNPATIQYFIEGRSDIFALFWFVLSLFLLERKHFFWSALVFGLALMSKQTIWFSLPFYAAYLWVMQRKNAKKALGYMAVAVAVTIILAGPFLLWDSKAFVESVVLYLSGSTLASYPVSGYGLGMLLYELGLIKDLHMYYPFIIWQSILGLPVLVLSLTWLFKKPQISRVIMAYAFTLTVFWYLSRYFNNSHLGYLSSLFALGVLKAEDEGIV